MSIGLIDMQYGTPAINPFKNIARRERTARVLDYIFNHCVGLRNRQDAFTISRACSVSTTTVENAIRANNTHLYGNKWIDHSTSNPHLLPGEKPKATGRRYFFVINDESEAYVARNTRVNVLSKDNELLNFFDSRVPLPNKVKIAMQAPYIERQKTLRKELEAR